MPSEPPALQKNEAAARFAAVIGYPIGHSISPRFQQPAFDSLGLRVCYLAREVSPDDLKSFLKAIRDPQWLGVNVTVPHKETTADAVDALSAEAQLIGAVNTVQKDGSFLIGHNTDAAGFLGGLADAGCDPQGIAALVLGAGGAARSVAVSLLRAGARHVAIANRTTSRAEFLVHSLTTSFSANRLTAFPLREAALRDPIRNVDLLVNATTVGMAHERPLVQSSDHIKLLEHLPANALIYDLIYNPSQTPLLKTARSHGYRTQGGLPMLIHQGAAAFELWTGQKAPIELMTAHARQAMAEREQSG